MGLTRIWIQPSRISGSGSNHKEKLEPDPTLEKQPDLQPCLSEERIYHIFDTNIRTDIRQYCVLLQSISFPSMVLGYQGSPLQRAQPWRLVCGSPFQEKVESDLNKKQPPSINKLTILAFIAIFYIL